MKPSNLVRWLGALAWLATAAPLAQAETKENPYLPIVSRNPFGLKPLPPPPDNTPPPPPAAPAAKVRLTGITSILSRTRALFEIEPGPGKQTVKPIMSEGEMVEGIEVVTIDVAKNTVTIKNAGVVTNITFDVAKSSPSPPAGGAPLQPVPPRYPGAPGMPMTSLNPTTPNYGAPGGSGNVIVAGGGNNPAAPASYNAPPVTANFGSPPNPATPVTTTFSAGSSPNVNVSDNSGLKSIPSRPPRVGNAPVTAQGFVDPAQQMAQLLLLREQAKQQGKPFPPFPGMDEAVQHLDQQGQR